MPDKKKAVGLGPSDAILTGRKAQPKKFTEDEQWLRDMWNEQEYTGEEFDSGYGLLPIPRDPFMNRPTIIGTQNARNAEKFFNIAPNLRGKVTHIQSAPGTIAGKRLQQDEIDADEFYDTNLLGVSDMFTGEVNLNPSLGKGNYSHFSPDEILAHEVTHLSGNWEEEQPELAEELVRRVKEKKQGIGPSSASKK